MRLGNLVVAALFVCGTVQMLAQPPHPPSVGPLGALLTPHGHGRPDVPHPQTTPEVVFDATSLGSPLPLVKNWRVGVTANPAAADPGFDDSSWSIRDATESIADVPDEDHPPGPPNHQPPDPDIPAKLPHGHKRPFAWFRIHIKLAPNHGPVALLIELPVSQNTSMYFGSANSGSSVDVFANGQPIRPEGPHSDAPEHYQPVSRIYPLNVPPSQTSLVLVVRTIYVPFGYSAYTSFFSGRNLRIGNPDDLKRALQLWSLHILFERLPRLVDSILLVVLGVFLLALYFTQKGHTEYLWLALHELVQAPIGFVDLAGSSGLVDQLWYAAVVLQLVVISAYLYFEFLVSFLALRRRWYIKGLRYTAPVLAGVGPTLLMVGAQPRGSRSCWSS